MIFVPEIAAVCFQPQDTCQDNKVRFMTFIIFSNQSTPLIEYQVEYTFVCKQYY